MTRSQLAAGEYLISVMKGFFAVEVFCGIGNLTLAMKHFLPSSYGIDHSVKQQRVKVIPLDLSQRASQQLVEEWCTSDKCVWVHFGVPCGTSSRARLKRMSAKRHGPPPLRSSRYPNGLPSLQGACLTRVRKANILYRFMTDLILVLNSKSICWTVENPWASFLWETSYWRRIHKLRPVYCELHNCMFGGERLKRTCLASNNPAERRKIMEPKKLALMQWIIEDTGYDDKQLARNMIDGFSLVGDAPKSGCLPGKLTPAQLPVEDLHSQSEKTAKAIRYMTRSSGDLLMDAQLWEKTISEVDAGWLVGPMSWDTLGMSDSVSRRFGLAQASKLRPIDDYSQSQVNSTVTIHEKPTVDNPDIVCALAIHFLLALRAVSGNSRIVARSLGLASAYRQLCISDESAKYAYLSVFDPTSSEAALFRQIALPLEARRRLMPSSDVPDFYSG